MAPIWLPGRLLGLPGAPQGRFFGRRFSDGFFDVLLTPFWCPNGPKMAGGPPCKLCPTLPSRALPTTYDAHTLLTFKPGLKSPGLSGTCRGKALNRKALDPLSPDSFRSPKDSRRWLLGFTSFPLQLCTCCHSPGSGWEVSPSSWQSYALAATYCRAILYWSLCLYRARVYVF